MSNDHQNSVVLLGYYGGDEAHALSAWTSTSRDLTDEKRERIPALLKMLADNGHETPFEKSALHFLMTTEIATHIHVIKHRIGVSVNAESARYKELKDDKFYVPEDWPEDMRSYLISHCETGFETYHKAVKHLVRCGMNRKRAKETARFFLPYASQITADVQFNFRSFVHFLKLRYSHHAQREVRDIARGMLEAVVNETNGVFNHTLRAFNLVLEDGSIREPFA